MEAVVYSNCHPPTATPYTTRSATGSKIAPPPLILLLITTGVLAVECDGVDAGRVETAFLGRAAREPQHSALGASGHVEGMHVLLGARGLR